MRSGIEFMSLALQKSMSGNSTVPSFVDPIDQNTMKRLLRTGIKYYYAQNDRVYKIKYVDYFHKPYIQKITDPKYPA